jgi:hypothetical protein
MTNNISYKNYFIRGESFQREKHGTWIPQYTVIRQETEVKDFPSDQYQFNQVFPTEKEADDFAVQKAQEWIDDKKMPKY